MLQSPTIIAPFTVIYIEKLSSHTHTHEADFKVIIQSAAYYRRTRDLKIASSISK